MVVSFGVSGVVGITRRRAGRSKAASAAAKAAEARIAEDLVRCDSTADAPDRKWLADVTEHPTDAGKLSLASVLDAFDKQIVGWSMDSRGDASDNAVIDSWHASLQTELLDRQHWCYRDELRRALFYAYTRTVAR